MTIFTMKIAINKSSVIIDSSILANIPENVSLLYIKQISVIPIDNLAGGESAFGGDFRTFFGPGIIELIYLPIFFQRLYFWKYN